MTKVQVTRGQTISFRIPSDTPEHLVKGLQKLKETERRNFSSKIAEFVFKGVSQTMSREQELICIPLPKKLTKAQRDWLKYEHSEALIGSILHHLISDPTRAAALLASLNNSTLALDNATARKEELPVEEGEAEAAAAVTEAEPVLDLSDLDEMEDDLRAINLENTTIMEERTEAVDDIAGEIDADDILADFLEAMNG